MIKDLGHIATPNGYTEGTSQPYGSPDCFDTFTVFMLLLYKNKKMWKSHFLQYGTFNGIMNSYEEAIEWRVVNIYSSPQTHKHNDCKHKTDKVGGLLFSPSSHQRSLGCVHALFYVITK